MKSSISNNDYRVYCNDNRFIVCTDGFTSSELTIAGLYSFLNRDYSFNDLLDLVCEKTGLTKDYLFAVNPSYDDIYWVFLGNKYYHNFFDMEFLNYFFNNDEIDYILDNVIFYYDKFIIEKLNEKSSLSQIELINLIDNDCREEFYYNLIESVVDKIRSLI